MSHRLQLKHTTADAHIRTEQAVDAIAAFDTRAGYDIWLRAMARVHHQTGPACNGVAQCFGLPPLSQAATDALARDLDELPTHLPHTAQVQHVTSAEIGIAYVMEGSGLGANILVKRAQKAGFPNAYLTLWANAGTGRWRRFVTAMDDTELDNEIATTAALNVFEQIQTALKKERHHVQAL